MKLLLLLLKPITHCDAMAIDKPPPSHSVLGCSSHSCPIGTVLLQFCLSVVPPAFAWPISLSLSVQVPGQRLVYGAGYQLSFFFFNGVSDPVPLPLHPARFTVSTDLHSGSSLAIRH